ncbi:histidine ammonia-lyase [Aquimarina sp. EL_43]|uniref:histidine ammonia-lyase n=1 Tax=unclassified Aquimarina TaxID=2627091 RepID=UPI0018CA72D4|nr:MULTISPECIES: histidine ammonia-lyase [unclassified Aquimarina]MBG6130858.1 histidine ammonia-lyase [Aquimarina sp. EL_35]MBG6150995.1 histidine ammonia-lyase [Aquimarina sp. EL_32]MBG6169248.1 histidine ammonia-lyase [Aquimarina sp. EL_43]
MSTITNHFSFGEDYLTAGIAIQIARGETTGVISETSRNSVKKSQQVVENIVEKGEPVYGINTGFGPLCTTKISKEETNILQSNILQSHSVGVGEPIDIEIAKLMLILKIQSLAKGYSGIAEKTLDRILWHINNDAIPIVPSQGSVGASGDLAPLSHLFLPLLGLGKVEYQNKVITTKELFDITGLKPLDLGPKEGLALINGTQFIAAHAVQVVAKLHSCLTQADIIGAMMIEGLQGSVKPFFKELHQLRPYKGNIHVASRIKSLLKGSEIMEDHIDCDRVQDPYSLRCMPQVHGSSRNAWLHLKELLEVELNSVTDNPIIINEELTISGGSFHGQPLAMAIDYACLAASELGNISDRRIYLALEGNSPGVPKLLMQDTGINSGYMILQYTTAALASENKGLCFPSSADSIPTSLGQEDHVSMGSIGGRKALRVIENLEKILAIELLTAAQAFEYRKPLKSGVILDEIHKKVREAVSFADKDRVFADDIEKGIKIIQNKTIITTANQVSLKEHVSLETQFSSEFEKY